MSKKFTIVPIYMVVKGSDFTNVMGQNKTLEGKLFLYSNF